MGLKKKPIRVRMQLEEMDLYLIKDAIVNSLALHEPPNPDRERAVALINKIEKKLDTL